MPRDDNIELGTCSGGWWVQDERTHIIRSPEGVAGSSMTSSTPLQPQCASVVELSSVGISGEAQDFYKQEGMVAESRWRCEEGCNGQRSFNCQVHSFFNDSSIPHHPFLLISMILPLFPFLLFFSLSLFFPSHLFSLPCRYFLILFFFYSISSSPPLLGYHG